MSSEDDGFGPTDERSALAWVMSGTVGALVVGGLAKHLIDRRRERALVNAAEPEAGDELEKSDVLEAGGVLGESDVLEAGGVLGESDGLVQHESDEDVEGHRG